MEIADDGWAQLAPFGEFPGVVFVDGGSRPAIQVIDRESGESLIRSVRSFTGNAARFFRSIPIFLGHPDVPALADDYPDGSPRGQVGDIQMRDSGIYIRPILNELGADLLNSDQAVGLSAFVDGDISGEIDGRAVVKWTRLRSVGFTEKPNLPVSMMNLRLQSDTGSVQRAPILVDRGSSVQFVTVMRARSSGRENAGHALRDTIARIPNSYRAWRAEGCPTLNSVDAIADPGTVVQFAATIAAAVGQGLTRGEALRKAVAKVPNSYRAWRVAGFPDLNLS